MHLFALAAAVLLQIADPGGAAVPGASVSIATPSGSSVAEARSLASGEVSLDLPDGSYIATVQGRGFASVRRVLNVPGDPVRIVLGIAPVASEVTVTAERGALVDTDSSASMLYVRQPDGRALPTLGHALEGAPGVLVQESTYGQSSPFLRGLTGYHVLHLVDGIRFNNATFRSGPNQYLSFLEPAQASRIEAMLGPSSAQYGSDSLGGTIQAITPESRTSASREVHGHVQAFGATADLSAGANASLAVSGARYWLYAGASGRHHNDLRTGGGLDSRNVYRRFFDLDVEPGRLQDTAFSQQSYLFKGMLRPGQEQSLTLLYQEGEITGSRAYKDLLGGLGRLRSDFNPQELKLFYVRYESFRVPFLTSANATFSVNVQDDGTIRQGLRFTDPLIVDDNRVRSNGYAAQGTRSLGSRHFLVFGGEVYDERIDSTRLENQVAKRALYPDGSRYRTSGAFAQGTSAWTSKLRTMLSGRLTSIDYRTFTEARFGVAESNPTFEDATFQGSVQYQLTSTVGVHALGGRGFRAPNANDLGAVGLNDLGYEVPLADAPNALLSTSAGEAALSTGRLAGELKPERLWNAEAGVRVQTRSVYARLQVFDAELLDPIVRRTLLFDAANVPSSLGSIPVTPLPPTSPGVFPVATRFDPRAVKAFMNDGHSRYAGVEAMTRVRLPQGWMLESGYSFLAGRELYPNRPVRRLPPQSGSVALRRARSRYWYEAAYTLTGAQERLSGGDLDDERIGASRSRNDIAAFYNGDRNEYRSETLLQIQDRVLPGVPNSVRVPLTRKTAGWTSLDVRGGYSISDGLSLSLALSNLLDKNYRVHGSGIDSPGRNLWLSLRYAF